MLNTISNIIKHFSFYQFSIFIKYNYLLRLMFKFIIIFLIIKNIGTSLNLNTKKKCNNRQVMD